MLGVPLHSNDVTVRLGGGGGGWARGDVCCYIPANVCTISVCTISVCTISYIPPAYDVCGDVRRTMFPLDKNETDNGLFRKKTTKDIFLMSIRSTRF